MLRRTAKLAAIYLSLKSSKKYIKQEDYLIFIQEVQFLRWGAFQHMPYILQFTNKPKKIWDVKDNKTTINLLW